MPSTAERRRPSKCDLIFHLPVQPNLIRPFKSFALFPALANLFWIFLLVLNFQLLMLKHNHTHHSSVSMNCQLPVLYDHSHHDTSQLHAQSLTPACISVRISSVIYHTIIPLTMLVQISPPIASSPRISMFYVIFFFEFPHGRAWLFVSCTARYI